MSEPRVLTSFQRVRRLICYGLSNVIPSFEDNSWASIASLGSAPPDFLAWNDRLSHKPSFRWVLCAGLKPVVIEADFEWHKGQLVEYSCHVLQTCSRNHQLYREGLKYSQSNVRCKSVGFHSPRTVRGEFLVTSSGRYEQDAMRHVFRDSLYPLVIWGARPECYLT